MKTLNKEQIASLKEHIDEKLRIRCINVETKLELVKNRRDEDKFKLSSTKFNTVPVIHSPIEVVDFGSAIYEEEGLLKVWIRVDVAYEGNGVSLFEVSGMFDNLNRFYSTK